MDGVQGRVRHLQSPEEIKQLSASTAGLVVGLVGCHTCTGQGVANFESAAAKHQDVTFAAHLNEAHMTYIYHDGRVHYYKGGEEVDNSEADADSIESSIQKLK